MANNINASAIYELTTLSNPSLDPGSRFVIYGVSQVDKETLEPRTHLEYLDLDDGTPTAITDGSEDLMPKISPDGGSVAFLRKDEHKYRQVWILPLGLGDPFQLTSHFGGVSEFAWAPDGKSMALIANVIDSQITRDDNQVLPTVKVIRHIRYRSDTRGWTGDEFRHLFLIDIHSRSTRQLTFGFGDESSPVWSPNGSRIAFITDNRPDRDMVPYTDAHVIDINTGSEHMWSTGLVSVAGITWDPGGNKLAAIGSEDPDLVPGWQGWMFILEVGEQPKRITDDTLNPVGGFHPFTPAADFRWISGGDIIFIGDHHGQSYLCSVNVDTEEIRIISGGNVSYSSVGFNREATQAVLAASSPTSASELEIVAIGEGSNRQITTSNSRIFKEVDSLQQAKFIVSRGRFEIECRLYTPPRFDSSIPHPLILDIHGGPHGVFSDSFNLLQQVLVSAGYVVLCVNPRGSSTYGADFAKQVLQDWGGEDYLDILAALEQACSLPYVDSKRLGIHGYSYGGYMGSWIIGHDDRFKGAVIGAPCIDLLSLYGTSDIGVSFGAVQWGEDHEDRDRFWRERSPITYATNVETPTLLLHGEIDYRVPLGQSELFFVALKTKGTEVELVRFPGCGHSMLRTGHPKMREEYLTRTVAWFDRHLG